MSRPSLEWIPGYYGICSQSKYLHGGGSCDRVDKRSLQGGNIGMNVLRIHTHLLKYAFFELHSRHLNQSYWLSYHVKRVAPVQDGSENRRQHIFNADRILKTVNSLSTSRFQTIYPIFFSGADTSQSFLGMRPQDGLRCFSNRIMLILEFTNRVCGALGKPYRPLG